MMTLIISQPQNYGITNLLLGFIGIVIIQIQLHECIWLAQICFTFQSDIEQQ